MHAARDILLLAAEDAFEFERWRESGPVIGDIDPEARAAEIAEFEALAIPMPDELDSLRRELEHAPKVREAIRNSALALRRNGRATASSLVALGPQQLMHPQLMRALGLASAGMLDPRIAGVDARVSRVHAPEPEPPARVRQKRGRKLADVDASDSAGALEAEVVERDDDDDDEDDDFEDDEDTEVRPRARKHEPQRKQKSARPEARRARPAPAPARDWDDDDEEDATASMSYAPPPPPGPDRNTLIFGGIAAIALVALLWKVLDDKRDGTQEQVVAQQQQPPPPAPTPAPTPPPAPAIDPNTGLPYGQVPPPIAAVPEPATPARGGGGGGSRGSGVRGGGGSSTPIPAAPAGGGGVNPFADYKAPDDPAGMGPAPAPAPAPQPQPADAAPPAGPPAPADGSTPAPAPAEQPPPAEPPKADDSLLTKSKMTPAIREAVVGKVGDLQACYQDAIVGKPDLAGKVVFTISLDQDGVVTKVDVGKDDVGYGVAKCSAKKIKRWTLPSAGIPIIFDLPFDFKS